MERWATLPPKEAPLFRDGSWTLAPGGAVSYRFLWRNSGGSEQMAKKITGKKTSIKYPGLTMLKTSATVVPTSPDDARLETFANTHPDRDYTVQFECPEFTSLCPITGQPDFGEIIIEYVPDKRCIESKSLKLYLFAFRNHGAFHEEVVNRILEDVVQACRPREAVVTGEFNPRGGIALSVTASYP